MISAHHILEKTKERFSHFKNSSLTLLEQSGSDRHFYRCTNDHGNSLIIVHYNREKEENNHYGHHALFLKKKKISVPHLLGESAGDSLLWLEDLGNQTLWSIRTTSWELRRPWYERTLTQIARLHALPLSQLQAEGIILQKPFDQELYRFEQNYFFEYALGSLLKVDPITREKLLACRALEDLSSHLAELPRQLIHRDLQSQNILLLREEAYLIDFQGMRAGLAPYDLASLLFDPYVTLTSSQQKELLHFYEQEIEKQNYSLPFDLEEVFWKCAAQRLMQALGCYGYLGLHRGKTHFLEHVPTALKRLHLVLEQLHPSYRSEKLFSLLSSMSPSGC